MITFICLFFPALISVAVYEQLNGTDLKTRHWIYLYAINVLFVNLACFFIKTIVLETGGSPMFDLYNDMVPSGAMNYLIMAIPIAAVLPVLEILLRNTVRFSIKDNEE